MGNHAEGFLALVADVANTLDHEAIDRLADELVGLRDRAGRLFVLGLGGSAANASHAVNDFRKLCRIEAYAPTDNVAELTAIANDEGWDWIFRTWLRGSDLAASDALLIFSVGGGHRDLNVSIPLIHAIEYAHLTRAKIYAVLGREGGYAADYADLVIYAPHPQHTAAVTSRRLTPLHEAFQAVIWHCLVSHPRLQIASTKW